MKRRIFLIVLDSFGIGHADLLGSGAKGMMFLHTVQQLDDAPTEAFILPKQANGQNGM